MRCRHRADLEYRVVVTVLNFQTDFLNSHYVHAHAQVHANRIEVVLTRSRVIPAEERLAQSDDGRALLQRVHAALFESGEAMLRAELERTVGLKVHRVVTDLDPVAGRTTINIDFSQPIETACVDGPGVTPLPS